MLDGRDNQAVDQIVAADRIIINKIDLVSELEIAPLERGMRKLNQTAEIVRSSYGRVDLSSILGISGFAPSYVAERAKLLDLDHHHHHDHHHHDHHLHDATVSSGSFVFDRPFDQGRLTDYLSGLLREEGDDIFRTKGIMAIAGDPRFFVLQAVHKLMDFRPDHVWGRTCLIRSWSSSVATSTGRRWKEDWSVASPRRAIRTIDPGNDENPPRLGGFGGFVVFERD